MPHLAMAHDNDPVDALQQAVGDIDDIEIFHNQLLVAIYMRPEKTAGGIYLTDTNRDEDKYQGKVGLVLKKGKAAFVSDAKWDFEPVDVGEWVIFKPSDGWSISVNPMNKVPCRILDDRDVRGRVRFPDQVW